MFPILYDENEIVYGQVPTHNGLGVLSDCLSCIVTEERNGAYELEMSYPASGKHAKDIVLRHLIKAKPNFTDNLQLFRIYKIGKVVGSSFKVYARHISYDLSGMEITTGSAGSCVSACALLSNQYFTIDTDKNVTANFEITEPSSRRSWLGGKAGSLLDVFGTGEYHYDNYNIHLKLHRGIDRGVEVRYGKNLLSLEKNDDSSNLVTDIICFWKSFEDGHIIYSAKTPTGTQLDTEVCQCIDVSESFETEPTVQDLDDKALAYVNSHNYAQAKSNITLDFLQLKTLKDRVDLCDEVKIFYEKFGINVTAKCIKTTWNVLKERYESIELGDTRPNFATTFINSGKETLNIINHQGTILQQAIDTATELITGNAGGYVVIHDSNNDGEPDEILIMNTNDISTATKVWRWNAAGLGYSNTGYAGTYGLAMTMDGSIVANFITTGSMSANRIRAGRLEDTSGNNFFDLDSGAASFENLDISIGGRIIDAGQAIIDVGNIAAGKVGPNQIRTAFAADSTSIAISSGTITFNADSFIVNSTNLEIDAQGNIKSKSFKSNTSIEFYNSSWATKYLDIGTNANSIPHVILNDFNGNELIKLETWSGITGALTATGQNSEGNTCNTQLDANHIWMYGEPNTLGVLLNTVGDVTIAHGSVVYDYFGKLELFNNAGTSVITATGKTGNVSCVSLTQTSTRKVKKNIVELPEAEAKKVLELKPMKFDFIAEAQGTNVAGFIAEDMQKILPSIVTYDEKNEANGIKYIELIPYLAKMLQLQQEEINELKKELKNE